MPTRWQKLQSLFYPVRIRKGSSLLNPKLELFYYHDRYVLGADNAIYSDGDHYRPLIAAFTAPELKSLLSSVNQVLVLGTGLASAVHVLHRYGYHPHVTLVEIDELVLRWAEEFLPEVSRNQVTCIHESAFDFIKKDHKVYDIIVVDIFFGRIVPDEVTQPQFIRQCKAQLSPEGHIVLNYMVNSPEDDNKAKAALEAAFGEVTEISFGINKVYIATA